MTHIIHITQAHRIGLKDGRLHIENHDETEQSLAFDDIGMLIIENPHCYLSAMVQLELVKQKITLIICDEVYQPALHTLGLYTHFQLTQRLSAQIAWNEERKRALWKEIVKQKIANQQNLLKYLSKSDEAVEKLNQYQNNLESPEVNVQNQEAIAARVYFRAVFNKGFKRFNDDGTNATLNYGYMVLRAIISTKIVAKGLHPSLGISHSSQVNNYNLSDDIIEVFRPIVDYIAAVYPAHTAYLEKEERQRILLLVTQNVKWQGKRYPLPQVIEYYIEAFSEHLSTGKTMTFPELEVSAYVY